MFWQSGKHEFLHFVSVLVMISVLWFQSYPFSSLKKGHCQLASCEIQEYLHVVFLDQFWVTSANINYCILSMIILEWHKQLSMSFSWSKNNVGSRIYPCGTPLKTGIAFDKWLSYNICHFRLNRQFSNQVNLFPFIP